jgi:hypothetical protein
MRLGPLVLTPLLVLLTTGCEKAPRERLQGKWVGESIQALHPSQAAAANGWAKGASLEFAGNKVTVSIPAESARSGTFKTTTPENGKFDVVFKRPEGGEDRATVALAQKDKQLVLAMAGGAELVMKKVD